MNATIRLTIRENEVIKLLCDGLSSKGVARALKLSTRTIEAHISNARKSNDCKSIAQLVGRYAVAVNQGAVKVSQPKVAKPAAPKPAPAKRVAKPKPEPAAKTERPDPMDAWRQSFRRHANQSTTEGSS